MQFTELLKDVKELKNYYEKLNTDTQAKIDIQYERTHKINEKADMACFEYRNAIRKLDEIIKKYE